MCKYSYLSGACANRRVDSLHCVGEDECEFSGMNILGSRAANGGAVDSGASRWLYLYCETHGRYLCGKENDCEPLPPMRSRGTVYLQSKLDDHGERW
jgi:hypothetical protein